MKKEEITRLFSGRVRRALEKLELLQSGQVLDGCTGLS